mgnify:CR=1 FL=1
MNGSLEHHGIPGMHWGVRRFQNSDGSLTSKGKKKVSAEYKKQSVAGDKELSKQYTDLYVKAYNKSAETMNKENPKKINADTRKRFDALLTENLDKVLYDFRSSTPAYQKADELVKKYEMTKWDDLASYNEATVSTLRAKYG